ncbi:MAG: hypothetical protein PHW65_05945, partial [Dehalococcoidales bacterium]|nr:hypothetical protein [Dehalococcoidales bacterium]
ASITIINMEGGGAAFAEHFSLPAKGKNTSRAAKINNGYFSSFFMPALYHNHVAPKPLWLYTQA